MPFFYVVPSKNFGLNHENKAISLDSRLASKEKKRFQEFSPETGNSVMTVVFTSLEPPQGYSLIVVPLIPLGGGLVNAI